MLIKWEDIYANTEILSPVDLETWRVIGDTSRIDPSSRVIELASGKGAFANYLAKNFGCHLEGFDINPEFVDHANRRARELGLHSRVQFSKADVNHVEAVPATYDLGVCLGALYIFRENGWRILSRAVKPGSFLAISDLLCKKADPPKNLVEVYFEEPNQPLTLNDAREWYSSRGAKIVREETCSLEAWREYYDRTRQMLAEIVKENPANTELQLEVEEGFKEDRLFRKYGEQFIDYTTFILQKS